MDILHIDFLIGKRRDIFQLSLISFLPLQVGGIPWSNVYTIKLDSQFYSFWEYIKKNEKSLITEPKTAIIEQKREGIDSRGYPWKHLLKIQDTSRGETFVFYPYTCDLLENVVREEND